MYSPQDNHHPILQPTLPISRRHRLEYEGMIGFPHSEIAGSKVAHTSPALIAACHVLHRLCMPRHPPNALTSRLKTRTTNDSIAVIDTVVPNDIIAVRIGSRQGSTPDTNPRHRSKKPIHNVKEEPIEPCSKGPALPQRPKAVRQTGCLHPGN
jgi:hypothetical protein